MIALNQTNKYNSELDFDRFLLDLKSNDAKAWNWLVAKFRLKLIPFLNKRVSGYPKTALLNKGLFLEEVIEETLLQFFKIFPKGVFSNYGNLEATVVTVAGYKLKEGFARLKKEQRLYFLPAQELNRLAEDNTEVTAEEAENIRIIKEKLQQLPLPDKDLLARYFDGEELQDIALDLNISSAACRKRKQRIIEKLKALVFKTISILLLIVLV